MTRLTGVLSGGRSRLAHVFDSSLPGLDALHGLSAAALVDALTGWAAVESAAAARRLAVLAEFTTRRLAEELLPDGAVDDYEAAAIEVGAALNISTGMAAGQMDLAMTLRTRLPRVAARYAAGQVSARTVATIARRTDRVRDRDALAALDTALAENLDTYGPLSKAKLEAAIDVWVCAVDPDAVHRTRRNARDRTIGFGDPGDTDGITAIWGRLLATDAKLLDARLAAMATAVCPADPRTLAQRRADALGALAAGSAHLACTCGAPACPAATGDGRAASVVVHVLTEAHTLTAAPDPYCHGQGRLPDLPPPPDPTQKIRIGTPTPGRTAELRETPPPPAPVRPAVIPGGPIVPAPLLAELITNGATIGHLIPPGADPHPGYRPPTAMDTWVRMRDLTCRAPGCDKPAVSADIDHTVPWPAGATHPSNTKAYCRGHHLTKTFWPGFSDRQHPDGTIEWRTPTGHTYTTQPLSRVLFPTSNTTTAALPDPPPPPPPNPNRILTMPKRKRTRTQQREYRINAERAHTRAERELNDARNPPPF